MDALRKHASALSLGTPLGAIPSLLPSLPVSQIETQSRWTIMKQTTNKALGSNSRQSPLSNLLRSAGSVESRSLAWSVYKQIYFDITADNVCRELALSSSGLSQPTRQLAIITSERGPPEYRIARDRVRVNLALIHLGASTMVSPLILLMQRWDCVPECVFVYITKSFHQFFNLV